MGKKAITPEMGMRIYALREERDDWGDHKWSCGAIAEALGVSESTIWRVVAKRSAYAGKAPMVKKQQDAAKWEALNAGTFESVNIPGMDEEIRASEARMAKALEKAALPSWAEQGMSPEGKARLALYTVVKEEPKRREAPLSPLDGGGGGEDETDGVGLKTLADNARIIPQ